MQNATFVFDQVVNSTDSIFYYCGVPGHCEKGMFGIVNAPNTNPGAVGTLPVANTTDATTSAASSNSSLSLGSWVMTQAATDPTMAAMYNYVVNMTMGTSAYGWGMNMDISGMPSDAYAEIAQNAMYTALMYAANPGLIEKGEGMSGSNLTIPADITLLAVPATSTATTSTTAAAGGYGNAAASTSSSAGTQSTGVTAGSLAATSSGSSRLVTSSALMGLVTVLASLAVL